MSAQRENEAVTLLNEATYRLEWAERYGSYEGDLRVPCEVAHDAIETALNAVIVAAGRGYRPTHDLSQLAKAAEQAHQPLPAELRGILKLPRYTGAGRYEFRKPDGRGPASKADYQQIVELAKKTVTWAQRRIRALTERGTDNENPDERGQLANLPKPHLRDGGNPNVAPPETRPSQPGGDQPVGPRRGDWQPDTADPPSRKRE